MRKTTPLFLLIFLLAVSLSLAACRPPVPQTTPDVGLSALEPCLAGGGTVRAECGVLRVPEDRANPAGRVLELKLIVVRAREAEHDPDPLFYLAGGPGVPATSTGVVINAGAIFRNINARRDIVFLDQRGTNEKHYLACEPFPASIGASTPQTQVDEWIKKCLAGLDGDPRFYTTAAFVQDLDDARAALGYDKINLYGISYGVTAEQVYMRRYPEHVRAVVMDHGTALDLPFMYVLPRASQSALDQVFTYCEQDEACRSAYPDIRGDWRKVMARLEKGPVPTSYIPTGMQEPASVTREMIASGTHDLMYASGSYSKIPYLVHLFASTEDWTSIVKSLSEQNASAGAGGEDRVPLLPLVIFCFDPAWGTDPDQVSTHSPDSYYADLEVTILEGREKICAALPKPDPSLIFGPGKPAPLSALMINSLIDPQNPPSNMDLALKEFTQSRVITETTEGHDTSGAPCRWSIVTEYIQQGTVERLDTACLNEKKPSFVISGN